MGFDVIVHTQVEQYYRSASFCFELAVNIKHEMIVWWQQSDNKVN